MAVVRIAEHAGACYGVERALGIVRDVLDEPHGAVCTLGPLIHNPLVVSDLEDAGVSVVESPEDVRPGQTLILRTHGVTPSVEERAREAGAMVVDATCPFVKKVHVHAARLAKEGYRILVVGEKGHPEVEGTVGHVPDAMVVGSAREAEEVPRSRRIGVVVQTTLSRAVLHEVIGALLGKCEELRVMDTICEATRERQDAAARLASQADVMVVVGGRNSANTTHLAQICADVCARTHHVESADELEESWFADAQVVGITAGASTPAEHIDRMHLAIERLVAGTGET